MKKICFMFVLISALFIFGLSFADNDSFGVNPPMNEEATARNGSVAQELVERGLIPLDGEGWAKHPIMPALVTIPTEPRIHLLRLRCRSLYHRRHLLCHLRQSSKF